MQALSPFNSEKSHSPTGMQAVDHKHNYQLEWPYAYSGFCVFYAPLPPVRGGWRLEPYLGMTYKIKSPLSNVWIWHLVQMAGQIPQPSGKTSKFESPPKFRYRGKACH